MGFLLRRVMFWRRAFVNNLFAVHGEVAGGGLESSTSITMADPASD